MMIIIIIHIDVVVFSAAAVKYATMSANWIGLMRAVSRLSVAHDDAHDRLSTVQRLTDQCIHTAYIHEKSTEDECDG